MAIAVNDILQITDVQTFLSQQMLNVYFYRVDSLEPLVSYQDISDQFDIVVIGAVTDVQHAGVTHTRIITKNLTNGLDIFEEPISVPGTASGDSLASFYAAGFRLVRSTALTRHGAKRIGGIPEGHVNGNDLAAGIAVTYNTVANVLGGDLVQNGTVDHDFVLQPVIVGRFPEGHAQAGELDLSVINPVASGQFIRMTTQTTRRAGRGS